MNFRYRLMQFLSGRYGTDETFFVMIVVASVLAIINCILRSAILQLIVYAIVLLAVLRTLSRNYEARRNENMKVKKLLSALQVRQQRHRQRREDRSHVYKKCPHCHAVLRLPRRKGAHTTACPRCGYSFKVHVFRE